MKSSRLLFLIQSMLLMVLLGSVYAWGVFRVEVENTMNVNASLSGLPYMISLVSYAFMMLLAGKWMAKHRGKIIVIGSLLFTMGFWLSSFVSNIYLLTITYGVFIGGGVGLLYGVPMYLVQKRFQHHVGFYSGLILMGFGLSNTLMTPIINTLLATQSLQATFQFLGWLSLGFFLICIWPLFEKTTDQTNKSSEPKDQPKSYDRHAFMALYWVFILSLISGLTIIGLSFRIGVINYQFDESFVTIAIAIFSLLNGLSRPFFGSLVDRFGFFKVAFISLISLVISGFISLFNGGTNPILYAVSFGAFWFGLGNWMALMPLSIKTMFAKPWFAALYGKLFTAYGVAAMIGTLFSGAILDLTNTTWPIYALIVLANLINVGLVVFLKQRYHLTFFK
jgi:MFS transporter, OFA family, oxalate/formate antiporter